MTSKLRNLLSLGRAAAKAGAWLSFLDFLVYRSPLGLRWARWKGDDFHRSTLFWFKEDGRVHTRAVFLLPRLLMSYPELERVDLVFEFYSPEGTLVLRRSLKDVEVKAPWVLDSKNLPADFRLPLPFEGSLLVKQKLRMDERRIFKKQGLFAATHTYLDYYSEGSFITTLHDYSAFLPDQGIQEASLGMIPAYCDEGYETFLVFHAARAGSGKRDLEVVLLNADGGKRVRRFPGLKPFAMKKVFISRLFPGAGEFLKGGMGQVVVRGIFRQVLRRLAYGIHDKRENTFSLDHCYYSVLPNRTYLPAVGRRRIRKGWFNPFFVIEDEMRSTSAILFQSAAEERGKEVDLLVYDAAGRLLFHEAPFVHLRGDRVCRISMRERLEKNRVPLPFKGHAELLYHEDAGRDFYEKELDVCMEYRSCGKPATVIFSAELWNPPYEIQNPSYRSVSRVLCNDTHTTYLAISNCSYDYDYRLEVPFTLSLIAGDKILEKKECRIGPNGTLFKPVEECFPEAKALLKTAGGVGLVTTTDIPASCLTHLFFTEDRKSRAFSVEHSLDV